MKTTLFAMVMAGSLALGARGGIFTSPVGAYTLFPNGTNDQSAAINAAWSIPSSVCNMEPGDYYATNLFVTASNIVINGNGARIHQLFSASQYYYRTNSNWFPVGTNFCFLVNAGANTNLQEIYIYNLNLDGCQPANYRTLCSFPLYNGTGNGMYAMLASPANALGGAYCITNNFGFGWNNNCGGALVNCTARNFGGIGFYVTGVGQTVPYTYGAGSTFYGCSATSNWVGFYFQDMAPNWEAGQLQTNFGNAEYCDCWGLSAANCAFGAAGCPSNLKLHDADFTADYIGYEARGGSDDNAGPHTILNNLKFNHCVCGLYVDSGCDYIGISDFYSASVTTNIIKRSNVTFFGGSVGNLGIYNDGGETNRWTVFLGSELSGVFGMTNQAVNSQNNVIIQGCRIFGKCSFCNGYLYDLNNFAQMPFNNWWTDVITNAGYGAAYSGSGMTPTYANLPTLTGVWQVTTNYYPATWIPVHGQVMLRPSNNWMFAISEVATNAAFKINP